MRGSLRQFSTFAKLTNKVPVNCTYALIEFSVEFGDRRTCGDMLTEHVNRIGKALSLSRAKRQVDPLTVRQISLPVCWEQRFI